MKTLVSVAVFGLVPIPPADVAGDSRNELWMPRDNCESSCFSCVCRPIIKRMATKEELARIRSELEAE